MAVINKISTYLQTGYLLHIITLAELFLLYILLYAFHLGAWVCERDSFTRLLIVFPLLWSPIFPQLDARSRYQDYKMMKDCFWLYGFDVRLIRHFSKSRCQRDAVMVAAKEMGAGDACRVYFASCGYRWYHLFPDIIFEKPFVLFSWAFYKNTFFAKTYHSKFDFTLVQVKPANKSAEVHVSAA